MLKPEVDELEFGVWYRSSLWEQSHVLGRRREYYEDSLSWCGMALDYVRDWQDEVLGGLFIDERGGGHCAYCKQAEAGWLVKS